MKINTLTLLSFLSIALATKVPAQIASGPTPIAASAPTLVPALVPYAGVALNTDGKPLAGEVSATFLLFKDEHAGEPLWIESQAVAVDPTGHFQVKLGATSSSGLPLDTFASGEVRWLEVQIAGEPTGPRVLLTSVPYALKAADAATLGGLPASAFMLASSAKGVAAVQPDSITPDASASNVTTTGGTDLYLPKFSGASTVVNSQIYDTGTSVGIGDVPNPSARLDVNGAMIMRGNMTVSRTGNATASKAYPSYGFDFFSNVYNSSTKATENPYFQLQSEPTGNDTVSPSATFNLLFSNNGSAPAETGLSINPNGTIKFTSAQTFPGTGSGTITGVSAGTGLTGGGTSGSVTLTLDTTTVPTLAGNPVFAGSAGDGATGDTAGTANGTAGLLGVAGTRTSFTGIAGVWGDSYSHVGVYGTSNQYAGVSGQSVSGQGVQGQSTSGTAVQGISNSSYGVEGSSTSADGILGYTAGGTTTTAGVQGSAGSASGVTGNISGVWGDAYAHIGVLGTSYQYPGVAGVSTGSQGVQGQSTSGTGVQGISSSSYGVEGTSTSAPGVLGYTAGGTNNTGGVVGQAGGTSGFSGISGVWGDSSSHVGVFGSSNSYPGVQGTSNSGNGVHGVSSSTSGIFGETSSSSTADAAIYGYSHNSAAGVYAFSSKTGMHAVSGGASNTGGQSGTFANGSPAIWGDGGAYAVVGTTDDGVAGEFFNTSQDQSALYVVNNTSQTDGYSNIAEFASSHGSCTIFINGDLQCTGNVTGVAKAADGTRSVQTYSVQSAENWYEDAGSGKLLNGVAHVSLEPTFGQTVNTNVEYHVFLTPNGDSDGLYVTNKTALGFDVHEQHGGHANIAFDYRIMAKPAGHETERLVDVTERMQKQAEMRQKMR